jgi:hypothetical protein
MSKFTKFNDFLRNKLPNTAGAADDMNKGLVGKDYDGPLAQKSDNDYEPQDYPDKPKPDYTGFVYKAENDDSEGLSAKKGSRVTTSDSSLGSTPESRVKDLPKRKLTAEEFVDQTSDMTDTEFVNFMAESTDTSITTITDLYGNEFTPDPTQTIEYMAGLLLANGRLMTRFIREVKRRDGLEDLISEMFDHPEAYEIAVEAMRHSENGAMICERLSRAMNDQYMGEMEKFLVGETVSPSMHDRMGWGKQKTDVTSGQPNTPMGGPNQPPQQQDPNMQSKGNPAAGGGMYPGPSDYDTPDKTYSGPVYKPGGYGHDIKGGQQMGQQQAGGQQPDFGKGPINKPNKRMMKEYAGDLAFKNLGESMIKYEDIRNFLKEKCVNC